MSFGEGTLEGGFSGDFPKMLRGGYIAMIVSKAGDINLHPSVVLSVRMCLVFKMAMHK
jgi:hypothetical protein